MLPLTGIYTVSPRTRRRIAEAARHARAPRHSGPARRDLRSGAHVHAAQPSSISAGVCIVRRLGWSARTWRAQFGCFDPALDQIVMNRWLDRPVVPRYAVEYVLFHEMLHVKHPLRAARCGIEAHSLKFRKEEKRYVNYERARKFLDRLP